MAQRWILGVVASIAVLALAGVGFAAFTATATVNGSASAASMGLEIVYNQGQGCGSLYGATPAGPGNFTFYGLAEGATSISAKVTNLTPGVYCQGQIGLENVGSVPVTVSVVVNTPGANGICTSYSFNCDDVETSSGIEVTGWQWYIISPTAGTSAYASPNFATLNPGQVFYDYLAVNIPATSTSAPGTGTFTLVYTASAGA